MRRDEAIEAIRSQRRARCFYGAGPREATHAEGRIIGYSDSPMLLIEADDGTQTWWAAELTEIAHDA